MAPQWALLLVLATLLAALEPEQHDPTNRGYSWYSEQCTKPQWDLRLWFTPHRSSYGVNEELQLTCPGRLKPSFTSVKCTKGFQGPSSMTQYVWWGRNSTGAWIRIEGDVWCAETCQRPQWDPELQLAPDLEEYRKHEEVMLSCPEGLQPSYTHIRCAGGNQALDYAGSVSRDTWQGRKSFGAWLHIEGTVQCLEQCTKPQWDLRLQFTPDRSSYGVNEELQLTCPDHLKPSFTSVKCTKEFQGPSSITQYVWCGRRGSGAWIRINRTVLCKEKCQKPQWDPRIRFVPDQESYNLNKMVTLTCPNGYWPSAMEITCVKPSPRQGLPVPQNIWLMKNSTGFWQPAVEYMECVEVLVVVPGTLEVSSTSIKLNWTCNFPDACQHMQATCRLAGPSSSPCEAEEVTGVELLHGQMGTFTCPPLQPFTDYTVTISVPPSTVLFSWVIRTKETVPQKPEQLQLDSSTGTLRWKALPSCQGEIVGYQLNITARALQDGGFLQIERLRLSSQTTEHRLLTYSPSTRYVVAVRGLTAVGPGAASLRVFHTNGPETSGPPDGCSHLVLNASPSQGTAVLPLHPISQLPEAVSEHQLLVAVTHNSAVLEDVCSGELQPSNHSQPPDAYVAAVLNLSTPTDFMLGDGTHGHGFHNAPLRPGWDYTALLRLARRSPQAETFTCVCYSFSMVAGQSPHPWPGIVIGVVVLLVLVLLFAGIVWFVQSRRRKAVSIKAKENN